MIRRHVSTIVPALALGAYVILGGTLVAHHEPWRDEADAWLMARDARVTDVVRYAAYAGSPVLWTLIQMPFAKAGAAYAWLDVAAGAAGIGLAVWQWLPPADGQMPANVFATFEPQHVRNTLSQSFAPGFYGRGPDALGLLAAALVAARYVPRGSGRPSSEAGR